MHHHRDERDELVRHLAFTFPKAFFENPEQRLPLKKNILEDLTRNCTTEPSTLEQAVGWYESHFAYRRKILSGAARIDLDGKPVAKITEAEQAAARRALDIRKQQMADRKAALVVMTPKPNEQVTPGAPMPAKPELHPALDDIRDALAATNNLLSDDRYNTLRVVLVTAALREIITEAEQTINALQQGTL
jgi:sRNA-binding protein